MLKGQLDIDMEFMGGTIIFVTLSLILMTSLLLPLLSVTYTNGDTNNDIKVIKFSNLVKHALETELSVYRGIDTGLLGNASERELSQFGLGDNYVSVRDITTGQEWEFPGKDGRLRHETFSTVSSNHFTTISGNLMKGEEAYVLHVYKVERNTVVDIYKEPTCSFFGTITYTSGLMLLGCNEFSRLRPESLGADEITDVIADVMNNGGTLTKLLIVGEDIAVDDIKPRGTSVTEDCLKDKDDTCFRIMEWYSHPAEIRVEIDKDAPLVLAGE